MIELRRVGPGNVGEFRRVRLAALQDTPTAFGSTYAAEIRLTDEEWMQRAVRWSGEGSTGYLAVEGGTACGIAGGYLDQEQPGRAVLVSMWVAPGYRQRGVGERLVGRVIEWARREGAQGLYLNVTSNNEPAKAFYERLGFEFTGHVEAYVNDASLEEEEMVCWLGESKSPGCGGRRAVVRR